MALDSAVYLKAGRCFHEYFGETPDLVHPFNLLAKPIYIKKTTVPAKPVMVCRTSTSITMKAETDGYEEAAKVETALKSIDAFKNAEKGEEKRYQESVRFTVTIPLESEETEEG